MVDKAEVLDHAQVVDVNGEHVGVVDHFEGDEKIKLAKSDPEAGGQHHIIPFSWVKEVDDNKVDSFQNLKMKLKVSGRLCD